MKKLEHFNFLLVQSQQQQQRNFNPSKSFYLQMIPNAITCYQNLLLTQRSIGQRNVQVGALRSRLAPDFSSFYYFTPEFFEEGRREDHPPSSLKISRTPTTKPCPYTMPPHVLLVTDFKTFPAVTLGDRMRSCIIVLLWMKFSIGLLARAPHRSCFA